MYVYSLPSIHRTSLALFGAVSIRVIDLKILLHYTHLKKRQKSKNIEENSQYEPNKWSRRASD